MKRSRERERQLHETSPRNMTAVESGKWDGRPRDEEVESLVVRMAEENRDWGYRRIQCALSNLGYVLARSTIAEILKRRGSNRRRNGSARPPGRSS
jgi:hypothetical protein